ncbi:hypothetical protein Dimus_000704 [Dionaea muscipula]
MDQMIVVKEAFGGASTVVKGRATLDNAIRSQRSKAKAEMPAMVRDTASQPWSYKQSYADILRGSGVGGLGPPSLEIHVDEDRTQWLYCLLVGVLFKDKDVMSFMDAFIRAGPLPFQLTDCGVGFQFFSQLKRIEVSGGRQQQGVTELELTTQRSHVSESRLHDGSRGYERFSRNVGTLLAADSGSKVAETSEGSRSEDNDDAAILSTSHTRNAEPHEIVPYVPASRVCPEQCHLVVDLGRAFGPIPQIQGNLATMSPRLRFVGLNSEDVGQGIHAPVLDDLVETRTARISGSQQGTSRTVPDSQQVITRLGQQGRLVGDSMTTVSLPASGTRTGRGRGFEKRRQRGMVRAAAAAVVGGRPDRLTSRE